MTKKYLDFKMGEGDKEKEWLDKEQPGNSEQMLGCSALCVLSHFRTCDVRAEVRAERV
jgi:hypothetical protein